MKNYVQNLLTNKVTVEIIGNNDERIIKRIKNNNIEILNLCYTHDGIKIKIYKKDYEKLLSIKTIYKINIISYSGLFELKRKLLDNKFIIFSILICILFLFLLSNLIFSIDIITNDNKLKTKIEEELYNNGIRKYKFKKSYNHLQQIKNNVLNKYRDEIEWIEIEEFGTKYIIKFEPRVQNKKSEEGDYRNIIAKKDAIIKNMYVESGQIVKSKNTYVKKGDIIVSGYVDLNGSVKDTVRSSGTIYGECWYNVTITYPYNYYEEKETGNSKNILAIKIFNNQIELFNFNKFKSKKTNDYTLLKNNLLPIKLIYQKQKETIIIDEHNNEKDAIEKAINYSRKKLEINLNSNEYVNDYKILNKQIFNDSIKLNIFFSVIEDITQYEDVEEFSDKTLEEKEK